MERNIRYQLPPGPPPGFISVSTTSNYVDLHPESSYSSHHSLAPSSFSSSGLLCSRSEPSRTSHQIAAAPYARPPGRTFLNKSYSFDKNYEPVNSNPSQAGPSQPEPESGVDNWPDPHFTVDKEGNEEGNDIVDSDFDVDTSHLVEPAAQGKGKGKQRESTGVAKKAADGIGRLSNKCDPRKDLSWWEKNATPCQYELVKLIWSLIGFYIRRYFFPIFHAPEQPRVGAFPHTQLIEEALHIYKIRNPNCPESDMPCVSWDDIKEFATTQTSRIRTKDLGVILDVVHQCEVRHPDEGIPCGYGVVDGIDCSRLLKRYNERKVVYHLENARYRDLVVDGPNGMIFREYYRNPVLLHGLDRILSGPTCDLTILDYLPDHLKWPDDRLGSSNYIYVDSLIYHCFQRHRTGNRLQGTCDRSHYGSTLATLQTHMTNVVEHDAEWLSHSGELREVYRPTPPQERFRNIPIDHCPVKLVF